MPAIKPAIPAPKIAMFIGDPRKDLFAMLSACTRQTRRALPQTRTIACPYLTKRAFARENSSSKGCS
jgi:hypothetical protein